MTPPKTLNVLDAHDGFTAITKRFTYVKIVCDPVVGEREDRIDDYRPLLIHPFVRWDKVMREHDTLWQPGSLLKNPIGTLDENVTKAIYKVPGYRYRIAVWFDNITEKRIA